LLIVNEFPGRGEKTDDSRRKLGSLEAGKLGSWEAGKLGSWEDEKLRR
jgi:hypothetical protein